jgi:GT2 family glycosyltransferase
MFNVGIIVLNWNGKEDTKQCLLSLQKLKDPATVFVVDNGSSDGSQEMIKTQFPEFRLIETGFNLGYAGGNNVGIELALKEGFSHIFILNNDTIVDPDVVGAFLEGFSQTGAGILGGRIFRMDTPDALDHLGGKWNPERMDFDYIQHDESPLDYVCGAALMVRREVFETVGLFDARFFLFWEEADFCMRAQRAGFSVLPCEHAKVWHKISASFTGGKPHAAYFLYRNRPLWIEKNFSGLERVRYFFRLFLGRYPRFFFSKQMRLVQLLLQKARKKDFRRNQERIIRLNAALVGMQDYLSRRFYLGRSKKFMNCD